ncbi:hypothetical protein AcW1_009402 [Taiwanofungus camphoratus]|nr:hypothetical protein AcV5_003472 [Antrodia cinnamomea]KAI0947705.1 hypothetical protein AcW1_009402 [Antrodia cinnamomea]
MTEARRRQSFAVTDETVSWSTARESDAMCVLALHLCGPRTIGQFVWTHWQWAAYLHSLFTSLQKIAQLNNNLIVYDIWIYQQHLEGAKAQESTGLNRLRRCTITYLQSHSYSRRFRKQRWP